MLRARASWPYVVPLAGRTCGHDVLAAPPGPQVMQETGADFTNTFRRLATVPLPPASAEAGPTVAAGAQGVAPEGNGSCEGAASGLPAGAFASAAEPAANGSAGGTASPLVEMFAGGWQHQQLVRVGVCAKFIHSKSWREIVFGGGKCRVLETCIARGRTPFG